MGTPVKPGTGDAGPMTRRADGAPTKGPVKARRARFLGMRGRRALLPWVLLAPALAVVGVLLLFPLGRIVWLSFREYHLRNLVSGESDFIGFDNYVALLTDPYLWNVAVLNTVVFAVVAVLSTVVLGTLVALLLANVKPVTRVIVISCGTIGSIERANVS